MQTTPSESFKRRCQTARCRACQTRGLQPILDFGLMPASDAFISGDQLAEEEPRYPLELAFCDHCSLLQILETVSPELLFSENYLYFSSCSESWLAHARENARQLTSRYKLDEESLVLELASNDGYLLRYFKQRGIGVLGVDPAPGPVAVARDKGINTICDFFSSSVAAKLCAEGVTADVVISNNVLAHVANMHDFIRGVNDILKPGGSWIIEVPYVKSLLEGSAFDTIYHEHLGYFSVKALQMLLAKHQLTINEIQLLDSHGGSLRLHVGRQPHQGEIVAQFVDDEYRRGLHSCGRYQDFANDVIKTRDAIADLLENLATQGQRIAAYGAAAKGTLLLNHLGKAARHVSFAVDRNVYKQGKWIPGVRIPILSLDAIEDENPEYLLLLPWNLEKEILALQQDYRQKGGRFIIPLPFPRIV